MKKIFAFMVACGIAIGSFAQVPEAFQYQAVVRNSSGEIFANQQVDLQIRILQDSTLDEVYLEEHQEMANDFGLVELQIGTGNNTTGNFSDIDWSAGTMFIETSIKDNGGEYQLLGTSQLLSVPYALHAKTVENTNDADADSLNEIQHIEIVEDTLISLTKSGIVYNLAHLLDGVEDADADSTNELITEFTIRNNYLIVAEGNVKDSINLISIVNDVDADSANELIKTLEITGNMLRVTEGIVGINQRINEVDLSYFDQSNINIEDADADSLNELQVLDLDTVNNILSLSNSDSIVDLTKYTKDEQKLYVLVTDSSVSISIDNADTITFSINDNDSVADNEIQNLAEVLAIDSSAAGTRIANIGMPVDDYDAMNKSSVDMQYAYLTSVFENADLQRFLDDTATTTIINEITMEGLLIDKRDNQIYRIKQFGGYWWMIDDLNYRGSVSKTGEYYEGFSTLENYGRLYIYSKLVNICPAGWSIPSEVDFNQFLSFSYDLMKVGGSIGFDFILSGFINPGGYSDGFSGLWTSTLNKAFATDGIGNFTISEYYYSGNPFSFNVRCIKN